MAERVIVLHKWLVRSVVTGRFFTTRHLATEETIKRQHPEATVVPGTREERVIPEDIYANSTSAFLRGCTDFGCGVPALMKKPPGGGLSGGAEAASEVADDELAALPGLP